MQREFASRGRRVRLEQVETVVAIAPAAAGASGSAGRRRRARPVDGRRLGLAAAGVATGVAREQVAAFERAGWSFASSAAEAAPPAVDRGPVAWPVFRDDDGRLLVGTDRLTVQLRSELSDADAAGHLRANGLEIVRALAFAPHLFEVRVRDARDPLDVSLALDGAGPFAFAEPVFVEHVPLRLRPTDPLYPEQWQWNNTGGGTACADIRAEAAWDMTRGAGIRVAVIDIGFDVGHEDLAPFAAATGFFDAQEVFHPGIGGFPTASARHGTFCAGMVGAHQNNGLGGCGAAPACEVIAIACLPDQVGTQVTLARAVAYAAEPKTEVPGSPAGGADVISCSLGPGKEAAWRLTPILDLAIRAAADRGRHGLGTPIFWATSNGKNVQIAKDQVVSHEHVIAVGRSTREALEGNTARGPKLEFLAPGVDVISTLPGNRYGTNTGTSFAAPCAAGVAALVLSVARGLRREHVQHILRDSCDKIGGVAYDANGHHDDYGFGRVNALRAVQRAVEVGQ